MPEIRTLATFSKLVMQHSTAQPAVIGGEAAHKAMLELGQLYEDLEKGVRNVSPYESVRTLDHCITQLKLENGGPRAGVQIAVLHDVAMTAIMSAHVQQSPSVPTRQDAPDLILQVGDETITPVASLQGSIYKLFADIDLMLRQGRMDAPDKVSPITYALMLRHTSTAVMP